MTTTITEPNETDQSAYEKYRDVMENPVVRAIGGWSCENHAAPFDEAAYVAKSKKNLKAFAKLVDEALELL